MNLGLGFSYLGVEFLRAFVSLIHTTNLLERFHTEIQRKQQDIGMFQRERGCDALWYLIITWETAKQRAACIGRGEEFAKKNIHYQTGDRF